jgi:MFS family permease
MLTALKRYFGGLSRDTFLLAFASLFSDISTEMLYPILPVFLTDTLGAKPAVIGIIEGIATAGQNVVQGVSGWISDKFQRRKPIALVGYIVAAISKPFIGLSSTWMEVLAARSLDRLAAGSRASPRDALVAGSARPEDRGKAFGLEGIGDNLGAFLGPIITIVLITWLTVEMRSIFFLTVIPGLAAALMILLVHEARTPVGAKTTINLSFRHFPAGYWKYLVVTAVFGLGNSSNSFLILRMRDLGASLATTVLIYAFFNLVAALASYPAGYLADQLGRKPMLMISFVVFFLVYLGFGSVSSVSVVALLFILYGVFQGIYRAVGKTLATDFVAPEVRASGVGWFSATVGLSGLFASIVGGELWTRFGPSSTFLFGATMSAVGTIAAGVLVSRRT